MEHNTNNNPPFAIGQRVVCIDSHKYYGIATHSANECLKEGADYVVRAIRKYCCGWEIYLGHQSVTEISICGKCGKESRDGRDWYFCASRFAPITPRKVEIEQEILDGIKETVESPDIVRVSEIAN